MRIITARRITGVAVTVALMAAAAQFSIPLPFLVPVTLQVPVMLAAGLILGPYTAAAAMAVYLVMGVMGLPVFASLGGGAAYVLKPGFGFLIGFIPASWLAGFLSRQQHKGAGELCPTKVALRRNSPAPLRNYIRLGIPVLALYAIGLSYQFFALCVFSGFSPKSALTAVTASLAVFLLADALKIVPVTLAYEKLISLRKYTAGSRSIRHNAPKAGET